MIQLKIKDQQIKSHSETFRELCKKTSEDGFSIVLSAINQDECGKDKNKRCEVIGNNCRGANCNSACS